MSDLEKLTSEFIKKEKKNIKGPIFNFVEDMFTQFSSCNCQTKEQQQKLILDFQSSKTGTQDFLREINSFKRAVVLTKFLEREVFKKTIPLITCPYVLKENNNYLCGTAFREKNNSEMKRSLTIFFGVYNHRKKEFLWNPREYGGLKILKTYENNLFKDLDILNHLLIKNITLTQAYDIAFFYRILWYVSGFNYTQNKLSSKWKINNKNLIIHEFVHYKSRDIYTTFSLVDLGIKEPPLNKRMFDILQNELHEPYCYYHYHQKEQYEHCLPLFKQDNSYVKKNSYRRKSSTKVLSLAKSSKKDKSLRERRNSSHKSTVKSLSLPKNKKSTQKNLFQKIKNFIFK